MSERFLMTNPALAGTHDADGLPHVFAVRDSDGDSATVCQPCAVAAFCAGQDAELDGALPFDDPADPTVCELCGLPIDLQWREDAPEEAA